MYVYPAKHVYILIIYKVFSIASFIIRKMECKLPAKGPSNEEVIEELTKDVKKSCVREECVNKDGGQSYDVNNDDDKTKEDDDCSSKACEADEVKSDLEEDEYFVDDVALKDRDLELTEEEKQVRQSFHKFISCIVLEQQG